MGAKSQLDFGDTSPENSLMHSAAAAKQPDFSGWATKYGIRCTDGRTILPGAFSHQDSARIPLVWQHGHDSPENVLGHAVLEHRDQGSYCYGYFNETNNGQHAKMLVEHEDINALSIFANSLVEKAKQVSHGVIRELSLVLAGANPGALIDNIEIAHGDGDISIVADEAIIYTGLELEHGDGTAVEETKTTEDDAPIDGDMTVKDVYDSMSPEQQEAVHYMVGAALEHNATNDDKTDDETGASDEEVITHEDKDENEMSGHNVFETANRDASSKSGEPRHVLSHDAMKGIAADAVKRGSLKEAFEDYAFKHGIESIDTLFPDARSITDTPEFDSRRVEWVAGVLSKVKKSPFSRIKS